MHAKCEYIYHCLFDMDSTNIIVSFPLANMTFYYFDISLPYTICECDKCELHQTTCSKFWWSQYKIQN